MITVLKVVIGMVLISWGIMFAALWVVDYLYDKTEDR